VDQWRVLLLLSVLVLLPVGRSAELPVLLAAIIALVDFWRAGQRRRASGVSTKAVPPPIRPTDPALRLALLVFLAYWLPELVSAVDSVVPAKSWSEVALDLRFLPFTLFAISALASSRARWLCLRLAAVVIALWTLDALFQASFGVGLGGVARGDRITGIFGDDNPKLGQVLATLAPVLLWVAWRDGGGRWLLVAEGLLALAIMLAGSRAGWVSFAWISLLGLWIWARTPRRFALAAALVIGLASIGGGLLYHGSDHFKARVDRTLLAMSGTRSGVDDALALRLPIWEVALRMGLDHPINGVGVRGFRTAYPDYAAADDVWVRADPRRGALHAHQIVLEIWTETGVIGLACWLAGLMVLIRRWRAAAAAERELAIAAAAALIAMCFPLNTHLAFYSGFWGLLFWWLLALLLALLAPADDSAVDAAKDSP
jgi:O-antigen ligase